MLPKYFFGLFFAFWVTTLTILQAQDTFSICAVDPVTGEVGSAGASCIAGSIILSDMHPGVGVVHTQSFWNAQNQAYARLLMNQGFSPSQIIDSLVANDAQGDPTVRQYGIVDLVGFGRSAAFTGVNCFDYKNHILGPNYAIQGNILQGQSVLDSMQARFLSTSGSLAEKLMAALQGAKRPGADTRCTGRGTSSISAFIRVAKPNDTPGNFYLDLNVNDAGFGVEPIDSLQTLFNRWQLTGISNHRDELIEGFMLSQNYPNPFNPTTFIAYRIPRNGTVVLRVYNLLGEEIRTLVNDKQAASQYQVEWDGRDNSGNPVPSGIYLYRLHSGTFSETKKMLLVR